MQSSVHLSIKELFIETPKHLDQIPNTHTLQLSPNDENKKIYLEDLLFKIEEFFPNVKLPKTLGSFSFIGGDDGSLNKPLEGVVLKTIEVGGVGENDNITPINYVRKHFSVNFVVTFFSS